MNRAVVSLCCLAVAATLTPAGEARRDLTPRVHTSLPFDLSEVEGIERAKLPKEAKALLAKNGFVVVGPSHGSMPDCYGRALWNDYTRRWGHVPFAARSAATRLLGLIAVGRSLGDPSWRIPEELPGGVLFGAFRATCTHDLDAVLRGKGTTDSFKPVGPYAHDPALARYYRLSQWWGAQGLRAVEREERLAAAILAWVIQEASTGPDELRLEGPRWELDGIENLYDPFFGRPDDVPLEHLMSPGWDLSRKRIRLPRAFGTDAFDRVLVERLKEAPEPHVFSEWDPRDALEPGRRDERGKGMRLLPPRLTPETRAHSRVIDPFVPGRWRPRGLDALAAFGDDLARELTLARERKPETREQLARQIDKLRALHEDDDGILNVQGCLRRLYVSVARSPDDRRLPLFMRTEAYHRRSIAAALATWAGAREIYSVRVKWTCAAGGRMAELPPGVVEPDLDAWQRLIELWCAVNDALAPADVRLSGNSLGLALVFRRIAEKQLQGRPLTKVEKGMFALYDMVLRDLLLESRLGGTMAGPGVDRRVTVAFARSMIPDAVRWAGKAVCPIYAIVEYGGALVLCKGGVFDYREFDLPPGRALTRKDFRKLMDSEDAPPAPEWTRAYRVEGSRGVTAAH
ncbi:MAG: DUF3160 domain-containing protein [Planctomycetota bacterium]|jgi:hypothetical protein